MPRPAVIPYPEAGVQLKRGLDQLADLLALTLGPVQGVIYSQTDQGKAPELLSDAATIARRFMQLPDPRQDVGAMLLRNLVWRVQQSTGDGGATAAVLAQAILDQAVRFRAAGANPMALRQGIRQAAQAALDALQAMAQPVAGEDDLVGVAQAVTGEPGLSLVLGEIFNLMGPEVHVMIEDYVAPYLEREYHEGGRWVGRLASPYLISDAAGRRAILNGCPVALFAGSLSGLGDVQPLLELVAGQSRQVTLVAHEIKEAALSALVANHRQDRIKVVAAELRRPTSLRRNDMKDLATLTGGTLLGDEFGRPLSAVTLADLGRARRVEADSDQLLVTGDGSQSAAVRQQIAELRARLGVLTTTDKDEEAELRLRLARLSGCMVTLKIGASTKVERAALRQKADKGLRSLPVALREGVVPGGGTAYLDCIPAVRALDLDGELAWGGDILARALEAPFRQIVTNANGPSADLLMDRRRRLGAGIGYDVLSGRLVPMAQAGILDPAGVLRAALHTAVSGAVMALTTDVAILKRRPETSLEP